MDLAVCGLGDTTAASGGVGLVVTPASALASYEAAVSGAVNKSVTLNMERPTKAGAVLMATASCRN
jgi:hypothetical protein